MEKVLLSSRKRIIVPSPRPTVVREIQLINRVEEMQVLREAADRAIQGEGGVIFLHGEAGIGKTRLAGRWNVTGNYWSDYTGNNTDEDPYGIGDDPYVIDLNNQDNFPFMEPYLPGDVTHDGKVDIKDIARIAKAYGSYPGHSLWDPHADLTEDAKVDMRDINIATLNYGKTWQSYWDE